jgi:hypothetical protein
MRRAQSSLDKPASAVNNSRGVGQSAGKVTGRLAEAESSGEAATELLSAPPRVNLRSRLTIAKRHNTPDNRRAQAPTSSRRAGSESDSSGCYARLAANIVRNLAPPFRGFGKF